MAPDFSGARAKVDHALDHLKALDDEMRGFFATHPHPIGGHYQPENAEITLYAVGIDDIPVTDWGLKVGDCLHNLRSALDHLAWQFALDHLGREPTEQEAWKIQFPLEDTPNGFKSAAVRRFVADPHLAFMDVLQPYQQGDRARSHKLAVLRRLSNLDKHRVVPAAAVTPESIDLIFDESSDVASYEAIELNLGEPMKNETPIGRVTGVVPSGSNPQMNANGPITFGVVLDRPNDPVVHRQPVVTVLGILGEIVDSVVGTAQSKFAPGGERPHLEPPSPLMG